MIRDESVIPEQTFEESRSETFQEEIERNDSASVKPINPLIQELLSYLNSNEEQERKGDPIEENPVDLYCLFTEMVVIKTELKTASRQMKMGLEEFKEVFSTLQKCNTRLMKEMESVSKQEQNKIESEITLRLKPLFLHLIEWHDRVERAIVSVENYKPSWVSRLFGKRALAFLQTQQEGQKLLLSRIEQNLRNQGIEAIDSLHQPFDAKVMCALGSRKEETELPGIVLEEIRKGYLWKGQLLRASEVIVNQEE